MVGCRWPRTTSLAERSNIARRLDACDEKVVGGLGKQSEEFRRSHSGLKSHDRRRSLVVDLNLTLWLVRAKAEAVERDIGGS